MKEFKQERELLSNGIISDTMTWIGEINFRLEGDVFFLSRKETQKDRVLLLSLALRLILAEKRGFGNGENPNSREGITKVQKRGVKKEFTSCYQQCCARVLTTSTCYSN